MSRDRWQSKAVRFFVPGDLYELAQERAQIDGSGSVGVFARMAFMARLGTLKTQTKKKKKNPKEESSAPSERGSVGAPAAPSLPQEDPILRAHQAGEHAGKEKELGRSFRCRSCWETTQ